MSALSFLQLENSVRMETNQSKSNPGAGVNRYSVFRRVLKYYSDDPTGGKAGEDAFDMRKPLRRDKKLQHIRPNGENHVIYPEDLYHG